MAEVLRVSQELEVSGGEEAEAFKLDAADKSLPEENRTVCDEPAWEVEDECWISDNCGGKTYDPRQRFTSLKLP